MGAVLAAIGAIIQITFLAKVLPVIGTSISVLGLLSNFGPLSNLFLGFGAFLAGTDLGGGVALFSLYCILGAVGGFLGGIVRGTSHS